MTTSSFALRPIAQADAEAVAALIRTAFGGISPPLVPPPSALRETTQSVAAHLLGGGGLVAEAEGRIVGCVLWGERDGGLYIGRLSVAADWRRAGVARALVLAAEDEARARGLPRLHLGVRLALAGNRRLFAGLGFRETVLHAHDGFAEPTWVDMEKLLG
jgi:predicted N-acetyltransferase YhbS